MKKNILKITLIFLGVLLLSWVVYAAITITNITEFRRVDNHTGYQINNWVTLNIDRWARCRQVWNTSGVSYFIPIKTDTEWYSFVDHKPSWISIPNTECYIPKWEDKWTSFWRRGPSTQFEVCYHWRCVNWNTAWESASVYIYWQDWGVNGPYPSSPNYFAAYTVKRWTFHHESGGSYYYYVEIK